MTQNALDPQALNAMVATHWPDCRFVCESVDEQAVVAALQTSPADVRPGGYICGPTLFAAADAALWFLAAVAAGRPQPMALTSDLSIRYLRPAIGQRVFARARLDKHSRRNMVGSVSIWMDQDEHSPCAIAQGSYILPRTEAD